MCDNDAKILMFVLLKWCVIVINESLDIFALSFRIILQFSFNFDTSYNKKGVSSFFILPLLQKITQIFHSLQQTHSSFIVDILIIYFNLKCLLKRQNKVNFSNLTDRIQLFTVLILLRPIMENQLLQSYSFISRSKQFAKIDIGGPWLINLIIMSRSVKSHQSSVSRNNRSPRQLQNAQIKRRIKDILYTVKEERQHIQNLLHQNDLEIHSLRQQYETMRYEYDFEHFTREEEVILGQIGEGLKQMGIQPSQIIGQSAIPKEEESKGKKLSKDQIIRVQQVLLDQLQSQLLEQ